MGLWGDMIEIDWQKAGEKIHDTMLKRGVSSSWVAHKAGIDRKTVDRARNGYKVRIQSISCIEDVLKINIISSEQENNTTTESFAPLKLGGYSRNLYKSYEGYYFMFRNSYDYNEKIICSLFNIFWNEDESCLKYKEHQINKTDEGKVHEYEFEGDVSIPPSLAITQFIRNDGEGLRRIMTTTNQRGGENPYFKGILMGINEMTDIGFYPATSPVFIIKHNDAHFENTDKIGSFHQDDIWLDSAKEQLQSAGSSFLAFYNK
jgi:hypothetical protein